jgi:hypothetical protein
MADVISGVTISDSKIAREAAEFVRQHQTGTYFTIVSAPMLPGLDIFLSGSVVGHFHPSANVGST